MKNYFFRLVFCVLLCFGLWSSQEARADHAAGGELIYDHISDSTYAFIFKFYRDCGGIPAPSIVEMCYSSSCLPSKLTAVLQAIDSLPDGRPNGSILHPDCDTFPNLCTEPNNPNAKPAYEEYWYSDTITLPSSCADWTFSVGISARSINLSNISSGVLYTETTLDNTTSFLNSSPRFLNKPMPFVCLNSYFYYNHQGYDPDGDSLVYHNIAPLTGPVFCSSNFPIRGPLPYTVPYTLSVPLAASSSGPFTFHTNNGNISFTPTVPGKYALAMEVDEYRNGSKIGSVIRDLQVVVLGNCVVQQTEAEINPPYTGFTMSDGIIRGCPGVGISFCIDIYSPDTATMLYASSTHQQILPTSTMNYYGQGSDSVKACFEWTPTTADLGTLHTFTVTATDTSCRPPGIAQSSVFGYSIYIPSPLQAEGDTSICASDTTRLWALSQPGDSLHWSVLSGDTNSISCTDCDTVEVYPSTTTQYMLSDLGSLCAQHTDTITVHTVPRPTVDIGVADTLVCTNSQVQLNPSISPPGNYTYQWSPATGLSATSIADPVLTPQSASTYYLEVTDATTGCAGMDSLEVEVLLADMKIDDPAPRICAGDQHSISMSGTAPDSFSYSWSPSTGLNDSSLMEPISYADSTISYVVTISRPGCISYQDYFTLYVEPVPSVDLGSDRVLCQWDTTTLFPSIRPTWFSQYTYAYDIGTNLSSTSMARPHYKALDTGRFRYILQVTTPEGCSGSDTLIVSVNPGDFMRVDSSPVEICSGDTVRMNADSALIYHWVPSDFLDDPYSAQPLASPPYSLRYTVYGQSADQCLDTGYFDIKVWPEATVNLGPDFELFDGQVGQLDAQGNFSDIVFTPTIFLDDATLPKPTINGLDQNTSYIATVRTENECEARDTIDVFYNPETIVVLPNGFAPEDDPHSTFQIITRGAFELEYFRIYNRWGEVVFETRDIHEGWNGKYKGEDQPLGTFVYEVSGTKSSSGKPIHVVGDFTLIR